MAKAAPRYVGGQAVLEGGMMRGDSSWAVAIRTPDGDVEVSVEDVARFTMVDCDACGGPLKPDVVYFGENVPKDRVDESYRWVDKAAALLVLGSSLHVYSGRRFVTRAAERGIPVAIVNQGPTKGDPLADIRVDAPLAEVLIEVAEMPAWEDEPIPARP